MLNKLRERAQGESGFTLIELLVVMLIIGLLAAIAIPSFFNQRDKANDADAKEQVRTAQTAAETYATDNNGSYLNMDEAALIRIEPVLNDVPAADFSVAPTAGGDGYTVGVTAQETDNVFQITRAANGTVTYPCTTAATTTPANTDGGCNGGSWE